MAIVGGILLVLALAAAGFALWRRRLLGDVAGTETSTIADLAASGEPGRRCELKGTAEPAATGPLRGPFSEQECVWYRARVTQRYWEWETRSDSRGESRRERVERTRVVSDESSEAPFVLDDGTGRAIVEPRGARVDRPEQTLDRFDPDSAPGWLSALGTGLDLFASAGTVGFQREEWVIRPGARLYLLGATGGTGTELRVVKPASGRYLVSTRSEEELTASTRRQVQLGFAAAAVLGAAGAVLLVLGLV
jgi:hypothetical protein